MLGKYCEFKDHMRLLEAEKNISICAISGAVGTFANISPKVSGVCCKKNES